MKNPHRPGCGYYTPCGCHQPTGVVNLDALATCGCRDRKPAEPTGINRRPAMCEQFGCNVFGCRSYYEVEAPP